MVKTKVVVFVRGGIVEEILANKSGVECLILDRDVEGTLPDRVHEIRYNKEDIEVGVGWYDAEVKAVTVDSLFNQVAI